MNLAKIALDQNRVTIIAMLVILAAGLQSYFSLPRDEDPGFLIRTAVVTTYFPGASPERVERLVTNPIETAIRQIPSVDYIESQSRDGVSIVEVELESTYFDLQPIWDDLADKVEAVRSDLPDGVVGPSVDDEYGDVFGILISITGPGFSDRELYEVAKEVRNELLFLPDAAKVELAGVRDEHVFLDFSDARLAEYGLSVSALEEALVEQNIVSSGGQVVSDLERISLEPTGNFETLSELEEASIELPGSGELVPLRDVVAIRRGYEDPPTSLRGSSGLPAVGVSMSMREGGNLTELGNQVRAELPRLEASFPIGIDLELSQFQPEIVEQKVSDFLENLLQSVLIVSLVMLVFLGLRTGLIVASLVPMAIIAALAVMGVIGTGIDQMSLAALIIALGMLVDNAIVMSESILVGMGAGQSSRDAAVSSARELAFPLLTSSLTTAAAFLPIYLAKDSAGEYTAPIFIVVTITLLCSWLISLTVIPVLCVAFLRVEPSTDGDAYAGRFYLSYRRLLVGLLRSPIASVAAISALLFVALWAFRFVPNIFFPDNDRPLMIAEFQFPFDTAFEHNQRSVERIEGYMRSELAVNEDRREGIVDWVTYVGTGGPRFTLTYNPEQPAAYTSAMFINATSRDKLTEMAPRFERWCNETFPGLKATVRPLQTGPPTWPPVEIQIMGAGISDLYDIVDQVKEELLRDGRTRLIDDDWGAQSKRLVVAIDQDRARRAGISSQDVATSLEAHLSGVHTTDFREGEELIPITLRAEAHGRNAIGDIESINVASQSSGRAVPLKQIADVEATWSSGVIRRRDRLRTITVEGAPIAGVTSAEINAHMVEWLDEAKQKWPAGYRWRLAGENESSGDANAAIGAQLPIAALAIVLLLVLQFNSARKSMIVLFTIPFGLIGVVIGLLVARSYFGFMTLLGVVSLTGIVINNSIVLIDRIQIELDAFGRPPPEAIVQASQRRLRPILLTTLTTVGGLIPLWLGGGPMFEPLAIAILFGLIFATVLTLGLVPCLYAIFYRVSLGSYSIKALALNGQALPIEDETDREEDTHDRG
ncbi:MAG: efflux RND transporter permease subunit [Myxococcota bacterium]